ncbi:MAG: TonB-dependent receptor [Cytophagales bacterium]|nr:TonB-dependent receptor [Cytophagales bacterium]
MSKLLLYGTILQTFFFTLLMAKEGKAQRESVHKIQVSVAWNNVTLSQAFSDLERKTPFKFTYHHNKVDDKVVVNFIAANTSLGKVLMFISENARLRFQRINDNIHVVRRGKKDQALTEKVLDESLWSKQISGTVTDENGEGLPGVNILVKGTTIGTITDSDGNYKLSIPDDARTLVFTYVGYITEEIEIAERSVVDLSLSPDIETLQEIVVVGYGTVKKSDLTGSVSSVSSEEITQVPVTSVASTLQGRAAGVSVNQASGQPGQGVIIRIRGNNSISGGNNPLYVIDGFPVDDFGSDINPEDIESIEILKDASATAIYGSRGANGVVMITTKRGSAGQINVDYHGFYGIQSLRRKIELLDRDMYVEMVNEIAVNEGGSPVYGPNEIANLPNNDWHDLVYRDAGMQSHQIAVSGGNESTRFYSSLNFMDQEGIIRNSGFERFSFRMNGDQKINEKLDLKTSLTISRSVFNQTFDDFADGFGAIPFTTIVMPPISPIRDANGDYTVFSGVPWGGTNPVGFAENDKFRRLTTRVLGNFELKYRILEGLNFRTSVGLSSINNTTDTYRPIGIISRGPSDGQASKSFDKSVSFINENILSYNYDINNHSFGALVGFTYQEDNSDGLSASGTGFVTDAFENNLLQSANIVERPSTSQSEFKLISYLGRVNYTFNQKYLFTFTGRYDGSSKFGRNNKYAFFPSAAFAWRVSDESFLSGFENISNLKLRTSIGKSGNQAIGPFQTLARLSTNGPIFGDGENVGFVLSAFENSDLKWETTTTTDVGIDLGLFNDRIIFTADYYIKRTKDLLFNAILPTSSGFTSSVRNVGEMENKGFEFELTTKNFTGNFKWTSSLNMTFHRNKVVSLGTDGLGNRIERIDAPGSGGNWFPLFLGEAGQQLYGFEIEGIYQTDAEAIENGEPNKTAGDYRFKDTDGNGIVNSDDQKILTDLQPDFVFGMNHDFFYKNFELSILMVGSVGNDIVNEFAKYYTALGGNWNVTREAWENRWTGPGSGGTFAKASSNAINTITFASAPNSLWVEDGSYLRFRDIKIAYNFSDEVLDKLGIDNLKLYVSGQNLITITDYSHYDPEVAWENAPVNGWDRGVYPSTRAVTFGLKANF